MSTHLSWKLVVAAQFRRRERAHAHDLVKFPFEEIEGTESRCCIWITGRDFLGLVLGIGTYYINTEFPISRGTREENRSGFMLLFHPNQMLVQTHRPFFTGFYRSPKNQIPHHYLLCFHVLGSRVRSSVHRKIELNPKPGTRNFPYDQGYARPIQLSSFFQQSGCLIFKGNRGSTGRKLVKGGPSKMNHLPLNGIFVYNNRRCA